MCVFLAAVPMILAAASAATSAYGMHQQGQAQAAAANYNATTAVQQGQSAVDSARINEQQTLREGDQLGGEARAAMSANGVDPNSGSALATQADIGRRTGQNVAAENYNAQLSQTAAINQSGLSSAQAGFDTQAAGIGEAGTLLSGASQVGSKWAAWQQSIPTGSGSGGGGNIAGQGSPAGWGSNGGTVGTGNNGSGSWAGAWS